jgi:hypothetical protein
MYLVLDSLGALQASTENAREAAEIAQQESGDRPYVWAAGTTQHRQIRDNPWLPGPEEAFAKTQLPQVSKREVMAMSEREAHARLLPVYQEYVEFAGRGSLKWNAWTSPGSGILGTNTKLTKKDKRTRKKAVALGISLLPEEAAFRWESAGGVKFQTEPYMGGELAHKGATFCAAASIYCKQTCLVNAGQNQSDTRNNYIKRAKCKALLYEPVAFMKMLFVSLHKYSKTTAATYGGGSAEKFVRLNVFSDIPWEMMAPWLFEPRFLNKEFSRALGKRLTFYDYTKVPGRAFMPRYDLSYSYSGINDEQCAAELAAGRRLVIVFVAPTYQRSQGVTSKLRSKWRKAGKAPLSPKRKWPKAVREKFDEASKDEWLRVVPLPKEYYNPAIADRPVRVMDGDKSDIRPFDPDNVIIGLRYKPPQFKGQNYKNAPARFVVRGKLIETDLGPVFQVAESPIATPIQGKPGDSDTPKRAVVSV